MAETITCFACEQEPIQQCPRCGRPYCEEHGAEFCDACYEPTSGLPSFSLYRGSLFALIIGGALALWLLIQPTNDSGSAAVRPINLTPTTVAATAPTATGDSTTTAGATTPTASGSPQPTATTTPRNVGTGATQTYTVVAGDNLSSICEDLKPASMTVAACVEEVVSLNDLSSANDISIGQELRLPR